MIKVFIDTSVFISACYSKTGASSLILGYCRRGKIKGYLSRYVLSEIKRNASGKLDEKGKQRLNFYLLQANLTIINDPNIEEISRCQAIINPKDAPILAAALKSGVSYLVTFNTKDFNQQKIKELTQSLTIITPKDFIFLVEKERFF